MFAAFSLGGGSVVLSLFAIALAGTGLLTTVGVIVSMDTFGPVSDNAQGIAEMSGDVHGEGAVILTKLDAVGNTTKAITKGIAIATAVLAATALFGAFRESVTSAAIEAGQTAADALANLAQLGQYLGVLDVANPRNLVGLLIGAAVVFLFSGLAINAVSRAAGAVIYEVRRQFRDHPGIMEGTEKPEYGKVVDIVTRDSLRELSTPGLLAMLTPIAVGFGLGVGALGTFLAGTIATGTLMAVFLSNSGGAWDNAKKFVEDGHMGGKYSDAHAATVIGDTVGDPFKDTAGPAINPLLKVMNLVALLIAPAVVAMTLDGQTTLRVGIALGPLAIIVGSLIASGRHRGGGEDLIDKMADRVHAEYQEAVGPAARHDAGRRWRPGAAAGAPDRCTGSRRRRTRARSHPRRRAVTRGRESATTRLERRARLSPDAIGWPTEQPAVTVCRIRTCASACCRCVSDPCQSAPHRSGGALDSGPPGRMRVADASLRGRCARDTMGSMTHDAAARVRAFLLDSDFTTDGVLARVGSEAFAALGRDLTVPVRRVLAASEPAALDRLIEAFLLADPIPADALPAAVVDGPRGPRHGPPRVRAT